MLKGVFTAMVTPFRDGRIDWERLRANVAFQIEKGIDGLVPVGTTGESPTLSHDEHHEVIECVVEAVGGKVKVIAGTGSNATDEALDLTRHAQSVGVDVALVVNPYYNKPTQEGLYRHFSQIADLGLPVVLYNIPGRTAIALAPSTIARLAEHPNVVAIKEATADMDTASQIVASCDMSRFSILSGDDSLTLPLMSIGAKGVISVLSNLIPDRVRQLTEAALDDDFVTARRVHEALFALFKVMFIETNPIPIKTAMMLASMDSGEMRLPLCEMSGEHRAALERALFEHEVLACEDEDEAAKS